MVTEGSSWETWGNRMVMKVSRKETWESKRGMWESTTVMSDCSWEMWANMRGRLVNRKGKWGNMKVTWGNTRVK